MKKLVLGSLITIAATSSVFAECTYNFDATETQISQIDSSVTGFPVKNNQKVGFNIVSNEGVKGYAAYSSAYAANKISGVNNGDVAAQTSGIFAYEYKIKVPTSLLSGDEALVFFPLTMIGTTNNQQTQTIDIAYSNNVATNPNKNELKLYTNFSGSPVDMPVVSTSNGYQTVGIYVNRDTNQVGLIHNGINKGYVRQLSNAFNRLAFINIAAQSKFAVNSTNLGQEISIELITDHTKLQNTYPTGTKDICGNVI
ncbi:DUF4882 family protein [Acinetobacter sp. YQ_14]|uniref:DUF4882 family protein n=1 Tax=Acinetobacter sp. YQ_14 TaxID=3367236 RepID=UPI00370B3846